MALFANLLAKLPKPKEKRMNVQGYALWICWQKNLDPVVTQTLQNYGGMFLTEDHDQSVWFFFNTDVFLALARLIVWARFNQLTVSVQLLSARFQLGIKDDAHLDMDTNLENQEIYPEDNLKIWIHDKAQQHGVGIPGLTFEPTTIKQGMATAKWYSITADIRLPYTSSQGWYAILRPLGNPLDKNYQEKWPQIRHSLAEILKKYKFKVLVHEEYIIIMIENLLMLRTWLRETLTLYETIKTSNRDAFWPHTSVIIDRKGLSFNHDLPNKVNLQWDKLSPDFPYMIYRTAFLLGEGFSIHDLRFSDTQNNMDSWCTVALNSDNSNFQTIPILMAGHLLGTDAPHCFHCGINTHKSYECPTKQIKTYDSVLLSSSLGLDLHIINEAFRHIEKTLSQHGTDGYANLLGKKGSPQELLETIFDINFASQSRSMPYLWLTKGQNFGKDRENVELVRDENIVWSFYDRYTKSSQGELVALAKELKEAITLNSREMRLRTLFGFVSIDLENYDLALQIFKDAVALTPTPLLQAWNEYLQARIAEIQGQFVTAITQYEQVQRTLPQWRDLEYRRIVCKVKMGFTEQILHALTNLIKDSPVYFYRCMIDPELGRGHALILMHLFPLWKEAEQTALNEKNAIQTLEKRIANWFPPSDPNAHILNQGITELKNAASTQSYMAFLSLSKQLSRCNKQLEELIDRQVDELRERYKLYLASVQQVRDEASWFPFPAMLHDFNDQFNEIANILNWAFASNFHEAEIYQKAQKNTEQVEVLLRNLKKKLKLLRAIRDSTLFGVTLGKTFLWIEIIGLLICFLGVPAIVMFGDNIGLGWLKNILANQQWDTQKALFGIITVISFSLAALRSTILFEKKRDRLLEEAREQRERMQRARLDNIRKKRQFEAEKLAKERKIEESRQLRLKLMGEDK